MKAIVTKFFGPGNVRGARIKAHDSDGNSVMVGYDYALNADANHRAAATALCAKLNWHGELVQGSLDTGYVFVWTGDGRFLV